MKVGVIGTEQLVKECLHEIALDWRLLHSFFALLLLQLECLFVDLVLKKLETIFVFG